MFLSPRSAASAHCRQEIAFAADRGKPVVSVSIEPAELTPGVAMIVNERQHIAVQTLTDAQFCAAVRSALANGTLPGPHPHGPDAPLSVDLAIFEAGDNERERAEDLHEALTRHLQWNDYPVRLQSTGAGNRLTGRLRARSGAVRLTWHLHTAGSGNDWSGRHVEAEQDFDARLERIADTVAEGVVETVCAARLRELRSGRCEPDGSADLVLLARREHGVATGVATRRRQWLQRALEGDPGNAHVLAEMAALLSWCCVNRVSHDPAADRELALERIGQALRIDSHSPHVLARAGTVHAHLGEADAAVGLCRRCVDIAPTVNSQDALAMALCFAGRPEQAVEIYTDILKTLPRGHLFAYGRVAMAMSQCGRFSDACEHAHAHSVHHADDPYGWVLLANAQVQCGDREAGARALQRAAALMPRFDLPTMIAGTRAAYGKTPEQASNVTAGLEQLLHAGWSPQ